MFDVVAFTNLSHDHLDDYADMEEYFEAKLRALPARARPARGRLARLRRGARSSWTSSRIPVTTRRPHPEVDGRLAVESSRSTPRSRGSGWTGPEGRTLTTRVPVIGWHMAANAALAIVMLVEAGFELDAIGHAIERDGGIDAYLPGRTERVSGDRGPSSSSTSGTAPTPS